MKTVKAAKCLNMCDRNCKDCMSCTGLDIYSLREIIFKGKKFIADFGNKDLFFERFGYKKPHKSLEGRVDIVRQNLPALERYLQALKKDYTPCLCPTEVDKIYQRVLKETVNTPCNDEELNVENFDMDMFTPINPETNDNSCIPYEPWEKALFMRMPKVNYTVDLKKCVKFLYDLRVTTKSLDPKFIVDFSVEVKDSCRIDYDVKIDEKRCEIEYTKLVENHECNLSLDSYVKVKECGFTYDTISKLYECNVNPYYDQETGEISFTTLNGNTYNSKELLSLHKVKNYIQNG